MLRTFLSSLLVMVYVLAPHVVVAAREASDPVDGWEQQFIIWAVVSTVIYLIVTVPLVYFTIKYKRKSKDEEGAYIEGNVGLEILWTVIPLVIIVFLGAQSWALFNNYRKVPKDAFEAKVVASMYKFEMISPEGIHTANELRVPVGHVKLNLTSSDVIHNFAVPAFRVREDMIPGQTTYLWFNAKEPGTYTVYCAEFCGTGHSMMLAKITVMPKAEYAKWVSENTGSEAANVTPEEKGKKLAENLGCTGCHSVNGDSSAGPTFKGFMGSTVTLADGKTLTADDAFVKAKIKDPKATLVKGFDPIMPPSSLSDAELEAITAWLKTLK
ncbi:MAG: cytochrome c oxidase subunit II [Nitrospirae bacterium]|uniref:cytochrome c oxidase subunit II n=1 Tax=Candidatus Magnetobacterium casense TaxID=1455061 RepID=UPI0009DCED17|nr:cytochrome c oxidase subunit II [Candidatus Magnetobacterium casensis]MBF0338444.1 cytochrome c oxidase subunit II [Nitrospirota bacterium]